MSDHFELLVRGGRCVTPAGVVEADVGVRGGKIAALGALSGATAERTLEAQGLTVLPGVIDSQVHFREPGLEHKEDLATGTASAALGGVTTIFEMPNTKPPTTTQAALEDKLARARGRAWVDYAFFVGASAENAAELARLELLPGVAGVKVFMGSSTGSLLVADDEVLRAVLRSGRRRVAVHAEDEPRLVERAALTREPGATAALHPVWRDEETALRATRRLLAAARQTGRRVHVLHVTTEEELEELVRAREHATVEVTPQHLSLAAPECYEQLGTLAQMNPPLRGRRHQEALWRAVGSGLVDVLGSDHAPHTLEEKARPYPDSPSGLPGVQTLLPLMLDHVHAGRLGLLRLVDLLCHGPARVYGLAAKGRLVQGYDADLTLVALDRQHTLANAEMATRVGYTPFHGRRVTGWPVATVVRGRVVMTEGELLGAPVGAPARFTETLEQAR